MCDPRNKISSLFFILSRHSRHSHHNPCGTGTSVVMACVTAFGKSSQMELIAHTLLEPTPCDLARPGPPTASPARRAVRPSWAQATPSRRLALRDRQPAALDRCRSALRNRRTFTPPSVFSGHRFDGHVAPNAVWLPSRRSSKLGAGSIPLVAANFLGQLADMPLLFFYQCVTVIEPSLTDPSS